jgi:hypothetical protein
LVFRKIVKRLRDERSLGDRVLLARSAADAIEYLMAENEKLKLAMETMTPGPDKPPDA